MGFLLAKVKNIDTEEGTYVNKTLTIGEEYTLPDIDRPAWASDDAVILGITEEKIQIGDGTQYFTSLSDQLDWLKSRDTTQKDSNNAALSRFKICPTGWSAQCQCIEWETALLDSTVNLGSDGNDLGFTSMKFFNASDEQITTKGQYASLQARLDAECVCTIVDWMPDHDYGIIGGEFRHIIRPTVPVRYWVIGVPAYPAPNGSRLFCQGGLNAEFMSIDHPFKMDGRTQKELKYNDPLPNTNELRIVGRHNAGFKHRAQMRFELFLP